MTRQLPDFEAWAIFAKVAELASFSAAARDLGISKPTVSKAIGRLETRLGIALFARTSRRLALTQGGEAALPRAMRILSEGEAIEGEAVDQAKAPRGRVRLSAPLSFGIAYLGDALAGFLDAYPDIVLDIALSDHRVDLVTDGFDLALRIASLDDSSLLSRRLCSVRILLVGAPTYFAAHGRPAHPADLQRHRIFGYSGSARRGVWRFENAQAGEVIVEPEMRLWSDNADLLNPALIAGHGLALQPEFLVWRALRDARLEIALPDWTVAPLGLHLLMPPSPRRPQRVQIVIDYLARTLAHPPWE